MKHVYPNVLDGSVISAYVEDALVEPWLALIAREHPGVEMVVKDAPRADLDLGGMMGTREQYAKVAVDDGMLETPLRHIEFAAPRLRRRQEKFVADLGEHAFLMGHMNAVILTAATAARVADEIEAAAKASSEKLEAEWTRHNKACYELGDPENPKAFAPTREQQWEQERKLRGEDE